MKNSLLIILASILLFLSCSDSSTNPPEKRELTTLEKKLTSSSDKFGVKIFQEVNSAEPNKNLFISPLSISMALGMTLNGANGSTYDAMQSTLEFDDLSNQEINEAYQSLISLLTRIDPKVTFNIANSIWYRKSLKFEEDFIETNKKYFNAEVQGLNFDDPKSKSIINNWVNKKTNKKIKKIIERISPNDIMYLINAIYFKGTWKYEFKKEATKTDLFYVKDNETINCEMMSQHNDFNYFENENLQMVEMPYGDGSFNMKVILPRPEKDIEEIISMLSVENLKEWSEKMQESEGTVEFPKIKMDFKIKLNEILSAMGMEIAFSNVADFTRLYKEGGCYISDVLHKTFVKIDEEGTEAAAVTSVTISVTSVGSSGFHIKMNRPFIFMITEKTSNNIIFIGKIVSPKN
ncbi:MAG: proteinase inhibitor I4 serpin [Ignavibacteriae bacterium]|nr:MAG: proteinase inhibitor I4 serpin [Ignavibacteriota bacterium]